MSSLDTPTVGPDRAGWAVASQLPRYPVRNLLYHNTLRLNRNGCAIPQPLSDIGLPDKFS